MFPHFSGEDWGAIRISKVLKEFGISGTFYLAVDERYRWGDQPLAELAKKLIDDKHDLGLHSHPAWGDKQKREHLWQYSLDEQTCIIKRTKEMLEHWTGQNVISHRAGAYGLNRDTIQALVRNNIPIDSSMFYGHPNCKYTWSYNQVVEKDRIIEVPVTCFHKRLYWKLGPLKKLRHQIVIKSDLDWCSLDDLLQCVSVVKNADLPVMILFMHSYSLLRSSNYFRNVGPAPDQDHKLRSFIKRMKCDQDITFISIREFHDLYVSNSLTLPSDDVLPRIDKYMSPITSLVEKLGVNQRDT